MKPLEKYGWVGPQKDTPLPAFHKLLETRWRTLNQSSSSKGLDEESSPLQLELLAVMGSYKDFHYSEVCPLKQGPQVRSAYCLHLLNHVLKANSQVLAHNAQLRDGKSTPGAGLEDEPRDQGLTRPKVKTLRHELLRESGNTRHSRVNSNSAFIITVPMSSGPCFGPVPGRSSPDRPDAHQPDGI